VKIVIDESGQTNIFDDTGLDVIELLCNHGLYLSDITLRMTPGGVSLQAAITSSKYLIDVPNSLMNVIEALNSIEG
jgi:hypothetical protein